ncbi:DUF5686 and carboxypeptidase-like regulatory domain-containing protein [Salmonirosea aquatica]|uniref:Carboxypeptidase-like regulatory domain-containing protein n=1 Tax=Salmonirosea aquatica TaxID=2654236 RepID=A0A7C9BS63_9BACT|nr:carboxypeptidase-like regulatory domain-containing protein [Cytophagaceae bacterium SJW1-29]
MNTFVLVRWIGFFGWLLLTGFATAQTTYRISGHITDSTTRQGIPFVSVAIRGTSSGATSDFEGNYVIVTSRPGDSLLVTSLGYATRTYPLTQETDQTIDIVLVPTSNLLQEVKVYAKGGDPAYPLIREAVKRRDQFDPSQLTAYQFDSYAKTEAYLDEFTGETRRPGLVNRNLAKLPALVGDDGKPVVPVFVSETYSEYYYRSNPAKIKEHVLKSRAIGVGISDGGLTAQFTGASFQQYNFYGNYVSLLRKDLPSPLGQYWEASYAYRLIDTVSVGGIQCYQIDFEPRQIKDLAFNGTVWIDTTRLGLLKIEANIDRRANINFVEALRLEQYWEDVETSGPDRPVRLPVLTQLLIDSDRPLPNAPGVVVRFYLVAQNLKVNEPLEPGFYEPALELAENYRQSTPDYWKEVRPQGLSREELRVFEVVDSVRNTPVMKTVGKVINLLNGGYLPFGSSGLELGPLIYSYANNDVEGHRLRLGLHTNVDFSRRWILHGYGAYGTLDRRFKYGGGVEFVAGKKPWTVIGLDHSYDLEQLGFSSKLIGSNFLWGAFSRFGELSRPYFQQHTRTYIRRELGGGFTQTVGLDTRTFDPKFPFAYQMPGDPDATYRSRYRTSELTLETRFAPGEIMVQDDNFRYGIPGSNQPTLVFRYELGTKALNGDFNYHRFQLGIEHSFRLGILGRTSYNINLGYTPSTLPYSLLFIPKGNPSLIYSSSGYNLMSRFEFANDHYAGLMFEHNFQGLLFNRIPAIKRLKWRFVVTGKALAGGVSPANARLTPSTGEMGQPLLGFQSLGRIPYVEVGYGIDNILKVIRVDAIHRLTHRDSPDAINFGIKVSSGLSF